MLFLNLNELSPLMILLLQEEVSIVDEDMYMNLLFRDEEVM